MLFTDHPPTALLLACNIGIALIETVSDAALLTALLLIVQLTLDLCKQEAFLVWICDKLAKRGSSSVIQVHDV